MRKTEPVCSTTASLTLDELRAYAEAWILDGECRQCTRRTLEERRRVVRHLLWWAERAGATSFGLPEIRRLLAYVRNGHEEPGGRWGNPRLVSPPSPRTVEYWFDNLRAFCNFLVEEGVWEASPMARMRAPVVRADQVQPFTEEQVLALLAAARRSPNRRRDEALLLFLLDTGARASEACGLRIGDLDLTGRCCTVEGKGRKRRRLYFGRRTARALAAYLAGRSPQPEEPVFLGARGPHAGEPLTRSGLYQLIERLGRAAGIESVRCSPHTFRHTYALAMLRNGASEFSVQQALGHTSLTMTRRYVDLAEADLAAVHRRCSPADRIRMR